MVARFCCAGGNFGMDIGFILRPFSHTSNDLFAVLHLLDAGVEQCECAHSHLQSNGFVHLPRLNHDGHLSVHIHSFGNRSLVFGRVLYLYVSLLSGHTFARMDFLCFPLSGAQQYRVDTDAFLCSAPVDSHCNKSLGNVAKELCLLPFRAYISLLLFRRLLFGNQQHS